MMFVSIPKDGYWLKEASIKKTEELYNAKYMGYWCTKRLDGKSWNEQPVDVFYVENPDRSKGHSNYFGLFVQNESLWITNAESAFSEKIHGIPCQDGEVIVSRYRHDYVVKEDRMIDGGRDYVRSSLHDTVVIEVKDGKFVIEGNV